MSLATCTDDSLNFLTEKELAQHLKIKVKTLQHWRAKGQGPPHIRLGSKIVRYRLNDVCAFLAGLR
jgi:predicted DNA-binding transcriptional regulator AlpA